MEQSTNYIPPRTVPNCDIGSDDELNQNNAVPAPT